MQPETTEPAGQRESDAEVVVARSLTRSGTQVIDLNRTMTLPAGSAPTSSAPYDHAAPRITHRVALVGFPIPTALRALITNTPGFSAPRVIERVNADCDLSCSIVVLYTNNPVADVRTFVEQHPSAPPILVISGVTDTSAAIDALRFGASSYLIDGVFTRGDFLTALVASENGECSVSPAVMTALIRRFHARMPKTSHVSRLVRLTRREEELLGLLSEGHSNVRIAERLYLAEKTVRNYISRLYAKIEVSTRAEAIVWWINHTAM